MAKQNNKLNLAKGISNVITNFVKQDEQRSYLPSHRLRSWKGAMSRSSFVPADSLDESFSSKERVEKS